MLLKLNKEHLTYLILEKKNDVNSSVKDIMSKVLAYEIFAITYFKCPFLYYSNIFHNNLKVPILYYVKNLIKHYKWFSRVTCVNDSLTICIGFFLTKIIIHQCIVYTNYEYLICHIKKKIKTFLSAPLLTYMYNTWPLNI